MIKDFLKNYLKNNGKVWFIFTQRLNYKPFNHGFDLAVGSLVRLYSRRCARKNNACYALPPELDYCG